MIIIILLLAAAAASELRKLPLWLSLTLRPSTRTGTAPSSTTSSSLPCSRRLEGPKHRLQLPNRLHAEHAYLVAPDVDSAATATSNIQLHFCPPTTDSYRSTRRGTFRCLLECSVARQGCVRVRVRAIHYDGQAPTYACVSPRGVGREEYSAEHVIRRCTRQFFTPALIRHSNGARERCS